MIEKRSEHRLKKETFVFVKNIVLSKNRFVVVIFYEFPEHRLERYCSDHLYFLLKIEAKFTTFRTL